MTQLLVVGAHLDDAILSCGRLLAAAPGAVVCTVFAGRPDPARGHAVPGTTPWDAACGFRPGQDVVGVRRAEDVAALAVLGARAVHLDHVDAQYGPRPRTVDLARDLAGVVRAVDPGRVVVPLGLLHRDHRSVAAAWLHLLAGERFPRDLWLVAQDAPYRGFVPTAHRLRALARAGVPLGPPERVDDVSIGARAAGRRDRAVGTYASQRAGLRSLSARASAPGLPSGPDADVVHRVLA